MFSDELAEFDFLGRKASILDAEYYDGSAAVGWYRYVVQIQVRHTGCGGAEYKAFMSPRCKRRESAAQKALGAALAWVVEQQAEERNPSRIGLLEID